MWVLCLCLCVFEVVFGTGVRLFCVLFLRGSGEFMMSG